MKKKLISLLICLILVISGCGNTFAFESGDNASRYGNELNTISELCRDLGIFKGFGGEYFELDRELAKAEMCFVMTQIINMSSVYNEEYYGDDVFSDVPFSHWAAGCINLMKDMSVVNGNGSDSFYPENSVSANEAVKMLVSALGYDVVAKARGGYPAGYQAIANELGILSGIEFLDNVTFGDVVLMTYNAFDTPLVRALNIEGDVEYTVDPENYDTVLTIRNIYRAEGQITANEYSSLIPGNGGCGEDRIVINDTVYDCSKSDVDQSLGHKAEVFYVDNSDKKVIIAYIITDEKSLCINSDDIISSDTDNISYDDTSRKKTAGLSDGAVFIYNGVAEIASEKLLEIKSGTITLVDSGIAGKTSGYDIVIIDSYNHMLVESVSSDDVIYFRNGLIDGVASLDISEAKIYKESKQVLPSDILGGETVAIRKSINSEVIIVEVISEKIYGTVSEYDNGERLIIDSDSYDISPEFSSYDNIEPETGLSGTFYIDKFGSVFYFMRTDAETKYAFCLGVKSESMGESVQLKLLTADSSINVFELSKNIEVKNADGILGKTVKLSKAGTESFFKSALRDIVFVYDTNAKNEINYIELPVQGDMRNDIEGITLDYTLASSKCYAYGRIGDLHINSDTCGFVICKDGDGYDEKNSYAKKGADFIDGSYYGSSADPIYFYDVSRAGVAGAVLDFAAGKTNTLIGREWPVLLVDSLSSALNDKGDEITVLRGIMNNSAMKFEISETASPTEKSIKTIDEIKCGDVLLMEKNQRGELNVYYVIYDHGITPDGKLEAIGNGYSAASATDTTVYAGYIYWLDSKNIRLCWGDDSFITFDMNSNVSVYICDTRKNEVYVGGMSDIVYSELNDYMSNSKIILRANRNVTDTIIVYK